MPKSTHFRLEQVHVDLFEEQIEDQEKIALSKAKEAWNLVGKPVLVDDAGAYFHQYNNFPGVFAKFVYHGLGFDGICKLMKDGDALSLKLTAVLIWGIDDYKIFTASQSGTFKKFINNNLQPTSLLEGMFIPDGFDKTYLELEQQPDLYSKAYYRAIAMRQVAEFVDANSLHIFG